MVKDSKSGQGKLPSVPLKPLLKNISETLQSISFNCKTHFFHSHLLSTNYAFLPGKIPGPVPRKIFNFHCLETPAKNFKTFLLDVIVGLRKLDEALIMSQQQWFEATFQTN